MSKWDIVKMIPKSLPDNLEELVKSALSILNAKVSPKKRALLFAALFYVAYTFDIIPDWIPCIGFMDDISILAAILNNRK
jgi:uncharacterized membrane protein YkvA (DUF1232 family)